ncbi:MAG: outer spore coat protein CotE [Candidatus Carbobacillus sp.]|nr:outer spore coat protein CotE [Candidatus Carbobacillus sp.]
MNLSDREISTREIITKAVVARGRRFSQNTHVIATAHKPVSILGCWVINHTFASHKVGDSVEVRGAYDVNVWYAFDNNTKTEVAKETISYTERIPLTYIDGREIGDVVEVLTTAAEEPNAIEAKVANGGAEVVVEKELATEVVGETKLNVLVVPRSPDEDEEDKEIMDDVTIGDEELIIEDLDER